MAAKESRSPAAGGDSGKSEMMQRFKERPVLFIGSFAILVLIVIAFVVMPAIVPGAAHEIDLTFGTYNKTPIRFVQNGYFHQAQMQYAQMFQLSGDDPNYMEAFHWIWRMAFEDTVIYTGMLEEMRQAGFTAPEAIVDREVAALPRFQENGRFSVARYRAMDNNSRMNLWRQVQESVAINYFLQDTSGLKISSREAPFVASMSSPRRSFDLVSFPMSSYPESEVISFAMANPGLFSQIHLSVITIYSSEREARQIHEAVRSGAMTFEEAAMGNSQDFYATRAGDMGMRSAYELRWEVSDEQERERIINLPQGDVSNLVRTPNNGWAFFRANQAAMPMDLNDDYQRNQVLFYIMDNMRGRMEDWLVGEAQAFVTQARALGFREAADQAGLLVQSFGPVPINYGDTALFASVMTTGIVELNQAGSNTFFWNLAFNTPLNSVSNPLVLGNDVIVLFPLEEIRMDEFELELVEAYFPEWTNSGFNTMLRNYFLNNVRLDDRFNEMFTMIWGM